jgi:hypothetical protein
VQNTLQIKVGQVELFVWQAVDEGFEFVAGGHGGEVLAEAIPFA